jgi:hypothetical protein
MEGDLQERVDQVSFVSDQYKRLQFDIEPTFLRLSGWK